MKCFCYSWKYDVKQKKRCEKKYLENLCELNIQVIDQVHK